MVSMVRIDQVPSFTEEAVAYAERQGLLPIELATQIEFLARDSSNFVPLDNQIFGLRVAPLSAPRGGDEYVLVIEHRSGPAKLIVFISILNIPLEQIQQSGMDTVMKRKINNAVSRIIFMIRHAESNSKQVAPLVKVG